MLHKVEVVTGDKVRISLPGNREVVIYIQELLDRQIYLSNHEKPEIGVYPDCNSCSSVTFNNKGTIVEIKNGYGLD